MDPNLQLPAQIDAFIRPLFPSDKPGAAVLVAKDGKIIFRKGYGMANMELGVRIEPHMVFRIGSITKQFTAVCILILYEQGRLDLQSDITDFLTDYPTGGRKVTIEQLLTHTSGIPWPYNQHSEWLLQCRQDFTMKELIATFKDKPFDFEPGEQFKYTNSGYILLGSIIENISGMTYAEFVQEYLFKPLGMAHSLNDNQEQIIPGRVAGYSSYNVNASFCSMTHYCAMGSLVSNVDDLAIWDAGLNSGKIIRLETLDRALKSFVLKDGNPTQYGYGWNTYTDENSTFVGHFGGLNGFIASSWRIPSEKLFVVMLLNSNDHEICFENLVHDVAFLVIGKPFGAPPVIEIEEQLLDSYCGVYKISDQEERVITRTGKQFFSQRTPHLKFEIFPFEKDAFFLKELTDRFYFERDKNGKVTGITVMRRCGPAEFCILTEKPLPF